MRKTLAILLYSFCGFCDFTFVKSGARAQGLGNASIGLSDNIYAIITNPAGMALITSYQTSFSYTLDEDRYDFLGISLPNCGIAVLSRKDKALYLSYGRNIKIKNKPISAGASIKLFRPDGIGLDLGILYSLRDNLRCGFVFLNFLRYGFGISARFRDFLFTADIKRSLHFGIEKGIKTFFIRAGLDEKRLSLGFSRHFFDIDMDLSISPLCLSLSF